MEGLTRSHGNRRGQPTASQQSSPEARSCKASEGSEADAQGAGEVGVRGGEQGSDGEPRSARMVEPAEE